ncbi:hypothetical protein CERSUDRAFT_122753 [Gelatoporia subvermispora B]|uniref:Uncharacterized protein n=1 Tax=Ceriporiopsis subvermispora (strain B) TaxID=914234 RepID=M2QQK9_CERS8|nr:hypothetical protein CERSUDRAFT_122753 [Gelatoporia subvermispora B]
MAGHVQKKGNVGQGATDTSRTNKRPGAPNAAPAAAKRIRVGDREVEGRRVVDRRVEDQRPEYRRTDERHQRRTPSEEADDVADIFDIEVDEAADDTSPSSPDATSGQVDVRNQELANLLDLLAEANPKKKPAEKSMIAAYHRVGRRLQHELGPNVCTIQLLHWGPTLEGMADGVDVGDDDTRATVAEWTNRKQYMVLESYQLLVKRVLRMRLFLDNFDGCLDGIESLTSYLDACAKAARGDEVGSLRDKLGDLVPALRDHGLHGRAQKAFRGFLSTITGRLLCPQARLAEFDADPPKFCEQVRYGEIEVCAGHLPSFLYDQKMVQAARMEPGLLRSSLLVKAYKCVYTGPNSVTSEEPGRKTAGKPSRAHQMKMTNVTARSIAHVATMMRFVLNSQPEWDSRDGNFDGQEFFELIVQIFTKKKWASETLAWWDKEVFGTAAGRSASKRGADNSAAAIDALMAELGDDDDDE